MVALALALGAALALSACVPQRDGVTPTPSPSAISPAVPLTIEIAAPVISAGAPAALQFPATGSGAVGIALPDGTVQVLGQGGTGSAGAGGTVPIASITKVITSLVVLDAHPLADAADPGPTITLGQGDLDVTAEVEAAGQFTEPMTVGQQVSLHDALAITLLTSANNYAESVAAWAFGSRGAYLDAARTWLTEHDLTATTLADASGLDPGSASSSADLLRVASLAHANPALASIAALAELEQADLGTIANQNILLGENMADGLTTDGLTAAELTVDGLKTGSTSYAGFTLLTSATTTVGSTPVTLVSVVLGTESLDARFATTRALLASARAGLTEVPLTSAGQVFGAYTGPAATSVDVVATDATTAVIFGDTPITTDVEVDALTSSSTLDAGAPVGTVTFTVALPTASWVREVPLTLAAAITG